MMRTNLIPHARPWQRLIINLVFCVTCIIINFAGSRVVSSLGIPLYLDSVGTVLASIMGGFVPGVLVGYFTNIVNSIFDPMSMYYSVISTLIAVSASIFAKRQWFKSVPKTFAAICIFALLGGGLASILTWCIYGFSFGEGITAPFVSLLYETGHFAAPLAQLCGDFLIDIVDKAVTVGIALLLARLLSSAGTPNLDFGVWMQTPLSTEETESLRTHQLRVMSIRTKVMLIVLAIMTVSVVASTWISYSMFNGSMLDEQAVHAKGICEVAKNQIDPSRVDEYLQKGDSAEGYAGTERALASIRDSFPEVTYLYVYKVLEDGCHVVLDPDTADEKGSDPGDVLDFDNAFLDYKKDFLEGKEIEPVISNESYGWLLTVYSPVYDKSGTCVCYVAVDLQMDHIIAQGYTFLVRVISLFAAFFILVCIIILWVAEYGIILPINAMAHANASFDFGTKEARKRTIESVEALHVHTGDEIEGLYAAVVKTATDTVRFVEESEQKTETIARMQENLIMVMADLVESRDQYTGDHNRKTAAYVRLILEQMKKEGIYADQLTDEFIDDVNKSAPLHDIGKIVVSDTILNKPGRLTDEEFAIMKGHTTAGREILEKAVSAVSDPMYLDEAKKLAEFHHEKWDGSGYPCGLAGEDIPLSGRIMAVADVFDALVSKRSYKKGFSLDKAFSIIEEGVGTHFDPQIAAAFLHARDEASRIARDHGDVIEE